MFPDYIYNLIIIFPFIYGTSASYCLTGIVIYKWAKPTVINILTSIIPVVNTIFGIVLTIKLFKGSK